MKKENVNPKGRKFLAMICGLIWGVLYCIACAIENKLIELSPFAIVIASLFPAYMGSNALTKTKK